MKRPPADLLALTASQAAPMHEAAQRSASPAPKHAPKKNAEATSADDATRVDLGFKVPRAFKKRFRIRAAEAGLKLNELLFEAFAVWEKSQGL